jgi:5-methylcytosine-specific restriction endonuclease McrA
LRTLVLNAGYEPLAVVSFKRAIILVLNEKAKVLAQSGSGVIRSATSEYQLPSVIILSRYVRIPRAREIPVSRRGVLRRDGHRCAYCKKTASTVDHIQPRSRGGADSWENLVACCLKCNNIKGDRTLQEIGWTLNYSPKMPQGTMWLIRGGDKFEPEWNEYISLASAA